MWTLIIFGISLVVTNSVLGECDETKAGTTGEYVLFDFTNDAGVDDWTEQSDTVRSVGLSKACLVLHQNTEYRRAVFFALLNPQSDGAGFAGMRYLGNFNLSAQSGLQLHSRGQGTYLGFKIVLRHQCLNDEPNYTWEQFFQAPKNEYQTTSLAFSDFKPYYRGLEQNTTETLDTSQISSIGIQFYGGIYEDVQQSGTSALEIDWIKAV